MLAVKNFFDCVSEIVFENEFVPMNRFESLIFLLPWGPDRAQRAKVATAFCTSRWKKWQYKRCTLDHAFRAQTL